MERHHKVSYKSEKALGWMYPIVKGTDKKRGKLLASWNAKVLQLMNMMGVESEAEICSGQVPKQPKGRRKHFDNTQVLNRHMKELRSE